MSSELRSQEQERRAQERAKEDAFLQKDYELKIAYLSNHFTRMWTRFNFFVAIETALVGGKFLISSGVPTRDLAIAGVLISAVWYIMGAEDRYLVRLYRHQVKRAALELSQTIWSDKAAQEAYRFVGQVDKQARTELCEAEAKDEEGRKKSLAKRIVELEWLSGWRCEPISTTRLAALFPLLVLVLWFIFLISTASQPSG